MRQLIIALLALVGGLAALAGWAGEAVAQRRVALVVGNSAYQHTSKLTNPKNDATDVAAALRQLGFQVIDGFDLDKAAFDRSIRDFAAALRNADAGLLFYAGHGLQVAGQNYLVPIDAKADTAEALDFEMVRVDVIQRAMERSTNTNILFLDACRDNPLARNLARGLGTRSTEIGRGLASIESGVGTLISFSTQPGNVALDGEGRNSPYAGALVKQLAAASDDLSAMLIAVRNDVMAETRRKQVPWEHSALTGRFYFGPQTSTGPPAKVAPGRANEAADAWNATKDVTNIAVLEAFATLYQGTIYAELARARIEDLKKRQASLEGPKPVEVPKTEPRPVSGGGQTRISDGIIKIGVLNDQTGPYASLTGQGSVWAARKAVDDFCLANRCPDRIEIVAGDHRNKPDIGDGVARQWFDVDKVDVVVDVPTSSVALTVNHLAKERNKVFLVSGAPTADLTSRHCTPNTIHWTYDTWALTNAAANAIVRTGGDSWFFLTADYAFGQALERDAESVILRGGGSVLGKVRHPFPAQDFSSFLLQAQASKAKIIGLANAGGDTINAIKQASEFGVVQGGQNLAAMLMFITDVHAIGLKAAQGLLVTEAWYWDANAANRAFAKAFAVANKGNHPTMVHAGVYSALTHYLKAVHELKSDADGAAVVAKMKATPTDDKLLGKGAIRPDGRKIHDMYVFEVKTPEESKAPWDYYKVRATIPAAEAFRPLGQGNCPLVGSR